MLRRTLLLVSLLSLAAPGWTASQFEAQGVTFPFYVSGQKEPAAVIHVERLYNDYQRKGFFRIGTLPVLVADTVTVTVSDSRHATNAFAFFDGGLRRGPGSRAVEWRRIRWVIGSESSARLQADRASARPGRWEFHDGVVRTGQDGPIHFRRALLQTAGPNAGELAAQTASGKQVISILTLMNNNKSTP